MTAWDELRCLVDSVYQYNLTSVSKLRWVPFLDTCVLETVVDLTPFPWYFQNHKLVQGKVFAMPPASGTCSKLVLLVGRKTSLSEVEPVALALDAALPVAVHAAARADALLALVRRVSSGSWEMSCSEGYLYSLRYPRESGPPLTVVPCMEDYHCFWMALDAQEEWLDCEQRWSRSRAAWIGAVVVVS